MLFPKAQLKIKIQHRSAQVFCPKATRNKQIAVVFSPVVHGTSTIMALVVTRPISASSRTKENLGWSCRSWSKHVKFNKSWDAFFAEFFEMWNFRCLPTAWWQFKLISQPLGCSRLKRLTVHSLPQMPSVMRNQVIPRQAWRNRWEMERVQLWLTFLGG